MNQPIEIHLKISELESYKMYKIEDSYAPHYFFKTLSYFQLHRDILNRQLPLTYFEEALL